MTPLFCLETSNTAVLRSTLRSYYYLVSTLPATPTLQCLVGGMKQWTDKKATPPPGFAAELSVFSSSVRYDMIPVVAYADVEVKATGSFSASLEAARA